MPDERREKSLFGDHDNVYDSSGKKIGEVRDSFFGDRKIYRDSDGRDVGYSKDALFGESHHYYDSAGNHRGSSRDSLFGDGKSYYDASGERVGVDRENLFTSGTHVSGSGAFGLIGTSETRGGPDFSYPEGTFSYYEGDFPFSEGKSRIGQAWNHIVVALITGFHLLVAFAILMIIVSVLSIWLPFCMNLLNFMGERQPYGFLFAVGWPAGVLISMILTQIFFTPSAENGLSYGALGFALGTLLMCGLAMATVVGWQGIFIPGACMVLGVIIGVHKDWRNGRPELLI